jgi:hypothetical protein
MSSRSSSAVESESDSDTEDRVAVLEAYLKRKMITPGFKMTEEDFKNRLKTYLLSTVGVLTSGSTVRFPLPLVFLHTDVRQSFFLVYFNMFLITLASPGAFQALHSFFGALQLPSKALISHQSSNFICFYSWES